MINDKILRSAVISFMIFIVNECTYLFFARLRIYTKSGNGYIDWFGMIRVPVFYSLSIVALYLSIKVIRFGFRSQNKFRLLPLLLSLPAVIFILFIIVRIVIVTIDIANR